MLQHLNHDAPPFLNVVESNFKACSQHTDAAQEFKHRTTEIKLRTCRHGCFFCVFLVSEFAFAFFNYITTLLVQTQLANPRTTAFSVVFKHGVPILHAQRTNPRTTAYSVVFSPGLGRKSCPKPQ
jgi:hypothetical protein